MLGTKHIRWIEADELGEAREYLLLPQRGRYTGNSKTEKEMFFSVEMRDGKRTAGFVRKNKLTREFCKYISSVRPNNDHIKFIEWENFINIVIEDGLYLGSVWFAITKEEFEKFMNRIKPTDWRDKYANDNR